MKERRTYRRTTLYPEKLNVGLTREQDKAITAIADRDGESRAKAKTT